MDKWLADELFLQILTGEEERLKEQTRAKAKAAEGGRAGISGFVCGGQFLLPRGPALGKLD